MDNDEITKEILKIFEKLSKKEGFSISNPKVVIVEENKREDVFIIEESALIFNKAHLNVYHLRKAVEKFGLIAVLEFLIHAEILKQKYKDVNVVGKLMKQDKKYRKIANYMVRKMKR